MLRILLRSRLTLRHQSVFQGFTGSSSAQTQRQFSVPPSAGASKPRTSLSSPKRSGPPAPQPAAGGSWHNYARKVLLVPVIAAAAFAGTFAAAQDSSNSQAWRAPTLSAIQHSPTEGDGAVVLAASGASLGAQLPEWAHRLADSGKMRVMDKDMLETHAHPMLSEDHMFTEFCRTGMVNDLASFYCPAERKFYSIVSLGLNTCGFRRITHGGMTAAIMDETLGGLFLALRQAGALTFWGPAFTAALEVSYKARIPGGSTVLCTCEVESINGRKVWMRATVSDGPGGKTYATARALFVSPKPHKLIKEGISYFWQGLRDRVSRCPVEA